MATKQQRGTKRTCQSGECGARFYDLNHDPIACPICGSIFDVNAAPVVRAPAPTEKPARKPKKVVHVVEEPDLVPAVVPEVEGEEALAGIEAEEPIAAEEDETFLEPEEEDGGDVATIIGPVEGEEEV